jgi:hypothetical protein
MANKRIRCPQCDGFGYKRELVQHPDPVRGHFFREKVWANKTCSRCKGKRWIKEPGRVESVLRQFYPEYYD